VEGTFYEQGWSLPNPLTGGLTCPTGYTQIETGRVLIAYNSDNSWGATQYGCFNMSMSLENTTNAGGYQTINDAYHDTVPNAYTKAESCPSGFTAYLSGSIVGPDTRNLSNGSQYVCLNNVFLASGQNATKVESGGGLRS